MIGLITRVAWLKERRRRIAALAHVPNTTPPATPTGFTAVRGASGPLLSWNANPEPDIDHYAIVRNGSVIATTTATTYTDTSASATTRYSYAVQAVNQDGYASDATSAATANTYGTVARNGNAEGASPYGFSSLSTTPPSVVADSSLFGSNLFRLSAVGQRTGLHTGLGSPAVCAAEIVINCTTLANQRIIRFGTTSGTIAGVSITSLGALSLANNTTVPSGGQTANGLITTGQAYRIGAVWFASGTLELFVATGKATEFPATPTHSITGQTWPSTALDRVEMGFNSAATLTADFDECRVAVGGLLPAPPS